MKNRILLDNYYLPGQLEQSIEEFVSYYNNCRPLARKHASRRRFAPGRLSTSLFHSPTPFDADLALPWRQKLGDPTSCYRFAAQLGARDRARR